MTSSAASPGRPGVSCGKSPDKVPSEPMSSSAGRALFSGGGIQVVQVDRGRCAIYRFIGANSPLLIDWTTSALRAAKTSVAINAREMTGIDPEFVQVLLDQAAKKSIALVSPPKELME